MSYLDHPLDLKLALSELQLEALFRLARGAPPQAIDGRTLRGLEAQRLVDRGSLTSTGRLVAAAYSAGFRRARAAAREDIDRLEALLEAESQRGDSEADGSLMYAALEEEARCG